jgi:DNA-binding HxlR family transcriptional regulator
MTDVASGPQMGTICRDETIEIHVVRDVLDRVGDKWSLLIMGMLETGPLRFTALQKTIPGISQRMLTHTLKNLQRDGLLSRRSFAEIPPRVEYSLTPLGQTLLPVVIELARWAWEHKDELQQNRDDYDDLHDL